MSGLVWGAPHVLWFSLLAPTAIGLAIYGWWRRTRIESGLFYRAKEMGLVVGDAAKWRVVRVATLTIGLSCLVLALARPQYGSRVRTIRKRGVDIVLCVDFSKSMNARDVRPSRIDRAKAEVARFASHLAGDRVAVIAFAGEPIEFPLTTDPAAVSLFLRDLRPDDMHVGGTAIGRALSAAKNVFVRTNNQAHAVEGEDPTAQRARVVVLLTDGEDHEGDPLQAAKELKEIGARLYTVGIGSRTGEPVPTYAPDGTMTGYLRDEDGNPVTTALTEAGESKLREIAQAADGKYFHAPRGGVGLESVEKEIRRMKQTELRARRVTVHEERYSLLLLPALLFLLLESLLPDALFGAALFGRKKQLVSAATVLLLCAGLPLRARAQQTEPSSGTARSGMIESMRARLFRRANPEVERGNARLAANDTQGALSAYDTAARTLPSEAGVHLNRGLALAQANDQTRARQAFVTAAQPNAPREVLGAAYYNLGRSFFAEADARAGEEKHDEAQRLFREALDAYRRSLRALPGNRDTAHNLEVTLRRIREEEEKQRQKEEQDKQKQDQEQQDQQNQQQQDQQQQGQQNPQDQQQNPDQNPPSQNQDPQQNQQQQQQNPDQQQQQNQQPEQQPQPAPQQGNANAQEQQQQQSPEQAQEAAPLSQEALQALDALREGERPYQTERARSMGRRSQRRPTKDW